jgi:hypothetical protein
MRIRRIAVLGLAGLLVAGSACAAIYKGRRVDGRWFEGRIVSTSFGAYDCQVKFDGDRATMKLPASGLQIVGFLEEEEIFDPHDITLFDPRRGVYWTLSVHNLGS